VFEFIEAVSFYPLALVVSATIAPGLTLCIPGLLFATVLLLLPIVVLALVVALLVAIVMTPFWLVRGARRLYAAALGTAEPVMAKELSA
jgi:hypothetical protein